MQDGVGRTASASVLLQVEERRLARVWFLVQQDCPPPITQQVGGVGALPFGLQVALYT